MESGGAICHSCDEASQVDDTRLHGRKALSALKGRRQQASGGGDVLCRDGEGRALQQPLIPSMKARKIAKLRPPEALGKKHGHEQGDVGGTQGPAKIRLIAQTFLQLTELMTNQLLRPLRLDFLFGLNRGIGVIRFGAIEKVADRREQDFIRGGPPEAATAP